MTKIEQKALLEERKCMLKTAWLMASDDSSENKISIDMPDGLKRYTIAYQKVIL